MMTNWYEIYWMYQLWCLSPKSCGFQQTYSSFLARSQLSTIIHLPCHCTVHVCIVIHCCGSMWSFAWKQFCAELFIIYFYIYCCWTSIYQKESVGIDIISFNTATCLLQARITNVLCCGLIYQLRWEAIVSFCWYWWNCFPSSFKLSLHNEGFIQQHLPICDIDFPYHIPKVENEFAEAERTIGNG
jgi:hypothetical protein